MDSPGEMLVDLTARIIGDRGQAADFRPGAADAAGAALMAEAGIALALASEAAGGFDLAPAEVLPLLRVVGGFVGTLPIAERLHANWLLSLAGLPVSAAAVVPAPTGYTVEPAADGLVLTGGFARVPWARDAQRLLCFAEIDGQPHLLAVNAADARLTTGGATLAGEPRDDLALDSAPAKAAPLPDGFGRWQWRAIGAAIRCQLIAGAAERVLGQTVQYVGERRQFGQPLAKFQAIQQQLAIVAGEVAAAIAAADSAAQGFGALPDLAVIAAAKLRCGEAAGVIAPIAHQLHGAIGFTEEHLLHRLTKQLWSWRDEYGSEALWADWLGGWALEAGGDGLWPALVAMDREKAHG